MEEDKEEEKKTEEEIRQEKIRQEEMARCERMYEYADAHVPPESLYRFYSLEFDEREAPDDMLGDMPNWLIHTGSYIVYGLIVLLVAGSALIKYPDIVPSGIFIDDTSHVEWVTARHGGMIDKFFVNDGGQVRRNDTLAIIHNAASLEDVKRFCRVLANVEEYYRTDDPAYLEHYPFDLILGDMSDAYEQFTQAVRVNLTADKFDGFPQRKRYLQEELQLLQKDSSANGVAMLNVRRNLFELDLEHKMKKAENRRMLELAYENMVNSLQRWEANYLIKSKSNGTVVLGNSWSRNRQVEAGDTVCSVMAEYQGNPAGHIRLDERQVADIKVGDKVKIELSKYPARTNGYLQGKVEYISYTPSTKSYAVDVYLPYGLLTRPDNRIEYEPGLTGKAEIITSSRSLLSRIFGPLAK